jgi:hypothetical protein
MCLVVTDIENSTRLSVENPKACAVSQDIHDALLMELVQSCQGVELLREGDSFRVAFRHAHQAVLFCLRVRESLSVLFTV